MKRISAFLFCFVVSLVANGPALAADYTVSFNQIVEHPALDALRQGVKDQLAAQGLSVAYNDHIAQGNIATANLIAKQILGEQPDVVVGIATPTAQACAQAIRSIPIVFRRGYRPGRGRTGQEPGQARRQRHRDHGHEPHRPAA